MNDESAWALVERLRPTELVPLGHSLMEVAERILGEHGLFIPDVSKHEPIAVLDKEDEHHVLEPTIQCICGWAAYQESFFAHLRRPVRRLVEGQLG